MDHYLSLSQAAKERGVSQDYLRFLIFKKKLHGLKIGRNWVTTNAWLEEYAQHNGHAKFKQNGSSPDSSSRHPEQSEGSHRLDTIPQEILHSVQNDRIRSANHFFRGAGVALVTLAIFFSIGTLFIHAGRNMDSRMLAPFASEEVWLFPIEGVNALVAVNDRAHAVMQGALKETAQDLTAIPSSLASSVKFLPDMNVGDHASRQLAGFFDFTGQSFKQITDSFGLALCKTLYRSCTTPSPVARKLPPTLPTPEGIGTLTETPSALTEKSVGAAPSTHVTEITRVREVTERTAVQTMLPVDLAILKRDIISDLGSINSSIRSEFESAIQGLRDRIGNSEVRFVNIGAQPQTNTIAPVVLSQKLDKLYDVALYQPSVQNGMIIQSGNLTVNTGSISAQSITLTSTATSTLTTLTVTGTVGIGTTSPWGYVSINPNNIGPIPAFVIGSSTQTNLIVTNTGNIGIGTTTPGSIFSIQNIANFTPATSTLYGPLTSYAILTVPTLNATSTSATSTIAGYLDVSGTGSNATSTFASNLWVKGTLQAGTGSSFLGSGFLTFNQAATLATIGSSNDLTVTPGRNTVFSSGNVGIATTSPTTFLSVHGNSYVSGTSFFGGAITATSTITSTASSANLFPYASSTSITVSSIGYFGTASSTNLTVSSLTSSRVPFITTAGAFTDDSDLTFTNGNLLTAGYASTTALSSSGSAWFATGGGNVGIGTASPAQALHVVGAGYFTTGIGVGDTNITTGVINAGTGFRIANGATTNAVLRGNGTNFVSSSAAALTKTDDTNVTLTLGGTPTTALLDATSLTLGWTGQLALTRGGTNNTLTADNGAIVYSDASKLALLASTATAGKVLQSGASGAPSWSTPTYPSASGSAGKILRSDGTNNVYTTSTFADTYTASNLLYSNGANTVTGLATANSSILVTDSSGVPSFSTTLPAHTVTTSVTVPTFIGGTAVGSSLALQSTSGVGTTDFIRFLVGNNGGTEAMRINNVGNVGIGTTAPAGTLHVAGQCVTGDTLLKRRRRRKKKGATEESEDDYEYDDVRIDAIKSGDEILSLNEETGKLEYQKIKQLADMGVKPIYKLTTASGKTIRTTGNHPYLVKNITSGTMNVSAGKGDTEPAYLGMASEGHLMEKWDSHRSRRHVATGSLSSAAPERAEGFTACGFSRARVGIFVDSSNLYHAAKKAGWQISLSYLKQLFSQAFDVVCANCYIVIPREGDSTRPGMLAYAKVASRFFSVKQKPLKYIFDHETDREVKKGDIDLDLSMDVMRALPHLDAVVVMSGDSDYLALATYTKERGIPTVFMSYKDAMAWELRLSHHLFLERIRQSIERVAGRENTITNPHLSAGAVLTSSIIARAIHLSSAFVDKNSGMWTKVSDIQEGKEIAVVSPDRKEAIWDRIVSIEKMSPEQVYDIEVEGTHNFIGNGIVAHNTAIFGAGEAGTPTATTIRGAAASGTNIAGANLTLDASNGTGTGGSGALVFRAAPTGATGSTANTLAEAMRITNGGNVGIGTTTPFQLFSVQGNGYFSGTSFFGGAITATSTLAVTGHTTFEGVTSTGATGSGKLVYDNTPTLIAPLLGTPTSGVATNLTGLPLTTGVTGTLPVANGGTGVATFTSSQLLYGNGTNALTSVATTTATISTGLSYSGTFGALVGGVNGSLTNTGVLSLGGTGQALTGAIIIATSTSATNGITSALTVTCVTQTCTFTPSQSGTRTVAGGGTGLTTFGGTNTLLYTSSADTLTSLTQGGANVILTANSGAPAWSATPTINTSLTVPTVIGGTAVGSSLNLQSTSGVGTTDFIRFLVGNNGGTEAMRILNSGNVGIGTTGPGSKLSISGAAGTVTGISLGFGTVTTSRYIGITNSSTENNIGTDSGFSGIEFGPPTGTGEGYLAFHTHDLGVASAERMRIDKSGNVGIGTTTPIDKLVVAGSAGGTTNLALTIDNRANASGNVALNLDGIANANSAVSFRQGGTASWTIGTALTASDDAFRFYNNSVAVMTLERTSAVANTLYLKQGNVGIGTTGPLAKGDILATNAVLDSAGTLLLRTSNAQAIDIGGQLSFGGYNNDAASAVSAWASVSGRKENGTTGNNAGYLAFATAPNVTAQLERMRITSAGNVGIGTTGPTQKLEVVGAIQSATTGALLRALDTVDTRLVSTASLGYAQIGTWTNHPLTFLINASEKMRIDTAGNVGIGTTGPTGRLTIVGSDNPTPSLNFTSADNATISTPKSMFFSIDDDNNETDRAFIFFNNNVGSSGSELMRIQENGNVGIGTTGPESQLHIAKSATGAEGPILYLDNPQSGHNTGSQSTIVFGTEAGASVAGTRTAEIAGLISGGAGAATNLVFRTWNGTSVGERMRIQYDGNVGIGTTSPWRTFSAVGTVGFSSSLTSATTGNYLCINTSSYEITSGTTCSASSERFKDNIQPIAYGLTEILKLNPVSFTYKKDVDPKDQSRKLGFIAEDVIKLLPELVPLDKDGKPEAVDYAKLAPVLTKAIQELDAKINSLSLSGGTTPDSLTIKKIASSLGNWSIDENGILMAVKIITDEMVAKKLTVGSAGQPSGITLYDEAGGTPYCVKIRSGAVVSEAGACSDATVGVPVPPPAPPAPAPTPPPAPPSEGGETGVVAPTPEPAPATETSSTTTSSTAPTPP